MSEEQLREWAQALSTGETVSPQAVAVLKLLDKFDHAKKLLRRVPPCRCKAKFCAAQLLHRDTQTFLIVAG